MCRQDSIIARSVTLAALPALLLFAACSRPEAPAAAQAETRPAAAPVAAVREDTRKCTNEPRTDENDKRPRCGGPSRQAGTGRSGYRIDIAGTGRNTEGGACVVKPTIACDIDKPFSSEFCGGTLTHTPTSDKGGTFEMHVSGNGGSFEQSGTYTLSGPAEQMTATYASTKACAHAGGRTICLPPPRTISSTWTRVENCGG